jgi:hypothetical protein
MYGMQLRVARLCLDCEELHDAQQCPVCASESFAYLTRWIPVDERRHERRTRPVRPVEPPPPPGRWVRRGAIGAAAVALLAAGQWARRSLKNARDAEFMR